jgi:hypothetical protein
VAGRLCKGSRNFEKSAKHLGHGKVHRRYIRHRQNAIRTMLGATIVELKNGPIASTAIRTLAGATITAPKNGLLLRAAIMTGKKPSKRAKVVRFPAPGVLHLRQMTIPGVHGQEMRQPRLRIQVLSSSSSSRRNQVHVHHGAIIIMALQPRQMRTPT